MKNIGKSQFFGFLFKPVIEKILLKILIKNLKAFWALYLLKKCLTLQFSKSLLWNVIIPNFHHIHVNITQNWVIFLKQSNKLEIFLQVHSNYTQYKPTHKKKSKENFPWRVKYNFEAFFTFTDKKNIHLNVFKDFFSLFAFFEQEKKIYKGKNCYLHLKKGKVIMESQ